MQEGAAKCATGIFDKGERWAREPHSEDRLVEKFLSAEDFPGLFGGATGSFLEPQLAGLPHDSRRFPTSRRALRSDDR